VSTCGADLEPIEEVKTPSRIFAREKLPPSDLVSWLVNRGILSEDHESI
jgi:hypothetical protein